MPERFGFVVSFLRGYSGHAKAAEAIEYAIKNICQNIPIQRIEILKLLSGQFLDSLSYRSYINFVRIFPNVWSKLRDSDLSFCILYYPKRIIEYIASLLVHKRLTKDSSYAICTHAFSAGIFLQLGFPVACVITDYNAHPYWVFPKATLYFVANAEVASYLSKRGIEEKRIRITGIPVHKNVREDKEKIREKLNLDKNSPVVLVSCGHSGVGVEKILSKIKNLDLKFQIIAVTGLRKVSEKFQRLTEKPIRFFGYTDNMGQLLAAADLFIGKAGGMMVSECLAWGVPMLLFDSNFIQEERNAEYLMDRGAAIYTKSFDELISFCRILLTDKEKLASIAACALKLTKPDAAYKIAKEVIESAKENKGRAGDAGAPKRTWCRELV